MKNYRRFKLYFIVLVLLCSLSTYAHDEPYGTVAVANDKYIDETEVDVGSWLSYYSWLLIHEGFETAQKALPDSSAVEPELWAYLKHKSSDFIDVKAKYSLQSIGYFSKECSECSKFGKRLSKERKYCAMLNFPITGVTYDQVVGFCEWRTKVEGNNSFVFRLPSPEEWKSYAEKGFAEMERNNGRKDSLTSKKCSQFNFKYSRSCGSDDYQGKLNGVGLYMPDNIGAYDIFGNVSEMTSVKNIAKGGNFKIYASQCHPDSVQHYIKSEIWLGFRCIAIKVSVTKEIVESSVLESNSINTNVDTANRYGNFIDFRDGKAYPTVRIGNQVWLAKNLAYKPDSGRFWVYNNEEKYVEQYGYLYTWETAKNVCPIGWHLPSKKDFDELFILYGGSGKNVYIEIRPSGKSGLSIIGCGLRYGKEYTFIDEDAVLWTSSMKDKKKAWGFVVDGYYKEVRLYNNFKLDSGLPVRCIKDK